VRRRGEDIRIGQKLIAEGATLDWRHIAVLAAQGVQYVSVLRRPRVTLLSSGRELRGLGESLAPGQIHDSSLPMLAALLHAGGAVVRTMAVVEDDVAAMRSSLRYAAIDADLVLTTAGIYVGEEDYVRDALRDLGAELAVHKVAMKPGKPLAFRRFEDAVFIGLPGNPLAALAGTIGFVRPLLARRDTVPDFQSLAIRIVTQNSVMTSLLRRVLSGSTAVCTETLNPTIVVMKSAQDGA